MAETYKQAPVLRHKGNKFISKRESYWQLPQGIMNQVFQDLNGKCGNQIKLMCLLLGTSGTGNFRVSEKWVLNQTGMDETGYKRARKELVKRGWLSLGNGELCVNIDKILRSKVDEWED